MDSTLILDTVKAGHLIGLAMGLGPAICADILVAKSFFRPIQQRDVDLLKWLHLIVFGGLVLLWATGLMLLQIKTGFEMANFTPKLVTKIFVVVLLTGNAAAIGIYALPRFDDHVGLMFGKIDPPTLINLTLIAGISMSCWLSAMALGAIGMLKPLPFETLQAIFAPVFMVGLTGAVLVGLTAVLIARRGDGPRMQVASPA